VSVSSNGYLTFGNEGRDYWNTSLPDSAGPNGLVAPFWDDLNPEQGGTLRYRLLGETPRRQLVVTWSQVPSYEFGGAKTFQVVIHEADGAIEFNYAEMEFDLPDDLGASATSGIENADASSGLEYSFNTPVLASRSSVVIFDRVACPSAADADGDRVCDALDNCTNSVNPGQIDTDRDGFGNACDGDFDQSGAVDVEDFSRHFLRDFVVGEDSGTGSDMDGNGRVESADFSYFITQLQSGTPGPSGLACAGMASCAAPSL
jgi:hypothetical protein